MSGKNEGVMMLVILLSWRHCVNEIIAAILGRVSTSSLQRWGQWLQQTKQRNISTLQSNCRIAQGIHISLGRALKQQAGAAEKLTSTAQWM
jgi:hypothetical protein